MNIDIIEPHGRIRIPTHEIGNNKISAIYKHKEEDTLNSLQQSHQPLFIGLSNGDLLVYHATEKPASSEEAPAQIPLAISKTTQDSSAVSIRTQSSYQDMKRLFQDHHENRNYKLANIFRNVTKDGSAVLKIQPLPISVTKTIILVTTPFALGIFEIVGTHINQIYSLSDCKNAVSLFVMHDDRRLLVVGNKKKMTVYQITNKSRNVFLFNVINETAMKDKIRTIDKYGDESILLGLVNDYVVCNYSDFSVSSLTSDDEMDVFNRSASFSYFGLSSSGPLMWTLPVSDDVLFLVKDTQIIEVDKSGTPMISPSPVKLASVPTTILFIYPIYLLVVYAKKLEILDIRTGDIIQKFHHHIGSSYLSFSIDDSVITIAHGCDIFEFSVLPFQMQIEQYLSISGKGSLGNVKDPRNDLKYMGIEKAILLVSNIDPANALFTDTKDKLMKLRLLYTLKAVLLFESYSKYHESLVDISSDWLVSFREVLSLFPDYLNGEYRINQQESEVEEQKSARSLSPNVVKRMTIEELELHNFSESEYDTDSGSKRGPHGVKLPPPSHNKVLMIKSQNFRKFIKAVNNLIVYLTEQRRVLSSFMNRTVLPWKGIEINATDIYPDEFEDHLEKVAGIIDTSLFLCYFYCKPMLLGPLLRLPNNYCNSQVVNGCLLGNIHNHIQQRNFRQPNFIKELLDFYYGRGLHADALEMLHKLAHEEDTPEHSNEEDNKFDDFLRGSNLTIQYLLKLTDEHLDLVMKYANWVIDRDTHNAQLIFMNDSYECESYDNGKVLLFLSKKDPDLGITYLEWLLFSSDIAEALRKTKSYLQFETKLCILYLQQLKSGKHGDGYYKKLQAILKSSETFEPWPILKEIPTAEDKYLRLTVYIYKKLGEHEKSVDVLFNQLNDLDAAMEYCLEIYNRPNGESSGSGLFYKLLEDLLMNYNENIELIIKLLITHGTKIPVLKILAVLPKSFPMHKLKLFFSMELNKSKERVEDTHLISQLYKVGSTNLQYKVMKLQDEGYRISSGKQPCSICNKKLGYSVFTISKDNNVVHYGCTQKRST
ncbi:Vacuolar morphogenesis protein 6 [Candida viswanathii]|uniref:Vacuolar morphogenesis protein 6 n=1 Tax=Candida viswanathii TaxID=5486 RepID=A0A367YPM9_9ASCO|nr:Vacuolar morphogenesis protein 6 [Candida viswanathii]